MHRYLIILYITLITYGCGTGLSSFSGTNKSNNTSDKQDPASHPANPDVERSSASIDNRVPKDGEIKKDTTGRVTSPVVPSRSSDTDPRGNTPTESEDHKPTLAEVEKENKRVIGSFSDLECNCKIQLYAQGKLAEALACYLSWLKGPTTRSDCNCLWNPNATRQEEQDNWKKWLSTGGRILPNAETICPPPEKAWNQKGTCVTYGIAGKECL
ncbi:MAG: hypothetical protein HQK54_17275 [Oligoflexales bacterium]|nr:hypothetical protein [Oligoflexales bacterium]